MDMKNDELVFGTSMGRIYKINPYTGGIKWTNTQYSSTCLGVKLDHDGNVYAIVQNGSRLVRLHGHNGEQDWIINPPSNNTFNVLDVDENGDVYYGYNYSLSHLAEFFRRRANGEQVYGVQLYSLTETNNSASFSSSSSRVSGCLCIGNGECLVSALLYRITDGIYRWQFTGISRIGATGTMTKLTPSFDTANTFHRAFFHNDDILMIRSNIAQLRTRTGDILWSANASASPDRFYLDESNNILHVGSGNLRAGIHGTL
jgi:outer membrane protein assembly factor BamB